MFVKTLDHSAHKLLKSLSAFPPLSAFYLAGESAAALHLGHRISVDLDFFTENESFFAEELIQHIQTAGMLYIRQQSKGTLTGTLNDVQISFFIYPYPLLKPCLELEGVKIASLLDISLMKIIAISQRGTMRDFIDLYFICREKYNLSELLKLIPQKYTTTSYPSYHLLRSLIYFSDAENDITPRSLLKWNWNEINAFFEAQVKILMDDYKQP